MAKLSDRYPFRRRKLLLFARFERIFFTYMVVSTLTGMALYRVLGTLEGAPLPLGPVWGRLSILAGLSIFLVLLLISGMKITNRLLGPIYRLQMHMQSVLTQRDFDDLSFRSGDSFQELVEPYNSILAELRKGRDKGDCQGP